MPALPSVSHTVKHIIGNTMSPNIIILLPPGSAGSLAEGSRLGIGDNCRNCHHWHRNQNRHHRYLLPKRIHKSYQSPKAQILSIPVSSASFEPLYCCINSPTHLHVQHKWRLTRYSSRTCICSAKRASCIAHSRALAPSRTFAWSTSCESELYTSIKCGQY